MLPIVLGWSYFSVEMGLMGRMAGLTCREKHGASAIRAVFTRLAVSQQFSGR